MSFIEDAFSRAPAGPVGDKLRESLTGLRTLIDDAVASGDFTERVGAWLQDRVVVLAREVSAELISRPAPQEEAPEVPPEAPVETEATETP